MKYNRKVTPSTWRFFFQTTKCQFYDISCVRNLNGHLITINVCFVKIRETLERRINLDLKRVAQP